MIAAVFASVGASSAAEGFVIAAGGGLVLSFTALFFRALRSFDTCRLRRVHLFVLGAGLSFCAAAAAQTLFYVSISAPVYLSLFASVYILSGRPSTGRLISGLLLYCGGALCAGSLRELLGAGTLFGQAVLPAGFPLIPALASRTPALAIVLILCALLHRHSVSPAKTSTAFFACITAATAAASVTGSSMFALPVCALAAAAVLGVLSHPLKLGADGDLCVLGSAGLCLFSAQQKPSVLFASGLVYALVVFAGLYIFHCNGLRKNTGQKFEPSLLYAFTAFLIVSLLSIN